MLKIRDIFKELERWIWKMTNILGGLEELRRAMVEADQRTGDVAMAKVSAAFQGLTYILIEYCLDKLFKTNISILNNLFFEEITAGL